MSQTAVVTIRGPLSPMKQTFLIDPGNIFFHPTISGCIAWQVFVAIPDGDFFLLEGVPGILSWFAKAMLYGHSRQHLMHSYLREKKLAPRFQTTI